MDKQVYVVAEGISTINGQPVPSSREMELTPQEALFDCSLGRISLKSEQKAGKPASRKSKSRAGTGEPDGSGEGDEPDEA